MSNGGELGRNEAQRQAISGVLARFTADRDNLLAAIQSCQQRVSELVDRLGDGAPATETSVVGTTDSLAERVTALEGRVAELERELRAARS